MGQLVDGVWHDTWYDTKSTGGRFKRSVSAFRNWLTADGAPGPSGEAGFAAEKDRYHLYVSLACPWAHRTLILRSLKGLEPFISVSVVNPLMFENGWTFDDSFPAATGDTLYQHEFLYQLYLHADPHYSGRVTVPVLWDKKQQTIVSNESAEIIRMLNTAFDGLGARAGDYYPPELRAQIDELNGWIYDNVNNGVYKAGFATSQQAYDEAVDGVFTSLERLEQILGQHRFLTGNQLTEADIRLWTTLVRFDPAKTDKVNAERRVTEAAEARAELDLFKKDLNSYIRFYEFVSQITSFDDQDLERLCVFARHLLPMLRQEVLEEDEIDLSAVILSHYSLRAKRTQDLKLKGRATSQASSMLSTV